MRRAQKLIGVWAFSVLALVKGELKTVSNVCSYVVIKDAADQRKAIELMKARSSCSHGGHRLLRLPLCGGQRPRLRRPLRPGRLLLLGGVPRHQTQRRQRQLQQQ